MKGGLLAVFFGLEYGGGMRALRSSQAKHPTKRGEATLST